MGGTRWQSMVATIGQGMLTEDEILKMAAKQVPVEPSFNSARERDNWFKAQQAPVEKVKKSYKPYKPKQREQKLKKVYVKPRDTGEKLDLHYKNDYSAVVKKAIPCVKANTKAVRHVLKNQ